MAINHLKKEIEIGENVLFRSLATIKFPDHIMVASKANRYPACTLKSLIHE